jgi:hypothetical protein
MLGVRGQGQRAPFVAGVGRAPRLVGPCRPRGAGGCVPLSSQSRGEVKHTHHAIVSAPQRRRAAQSVIVMSSTELRRINSAGWRPRLDGVSWRSQAR